jgi:hypothetical protein
MTPQQMEQTVSSGVDPVRQNPLSPAAQPAINQVRPGIYRQGNSFSDTPEGAAAGARPAPISAQNMAAADALAQRYTNPLVQAAQAPQGSQNLTPQTSGSGYGLLDQGARDRRSAMMDAQQFKPGARASLAALLKEQGAQGDRKAQADQNAADREFRQGESAMDRAMRGTELNAKLGESAADRALRSQEVADNSLTNKVKRDAAGLELGSAKQLADLRSAYLNAKTPEEQASAISKLNALSGKAGTSMKDNFMVVGGGQEWDEKAMAMRNVPQQLIDLRTGQPAQGGQQAQASQSGPKQISSKADYDALPKGASYISPDGVQRTKS